MDNLLTFMEYANSDYFSLEKLGMKKALLYDLANRCGFEVLTKRKNGATLYKLKKIGIPCETLYTHEQKSTFNYVDMADLHIGHERCEIAKIKNALDYAVKIGAEYVFIAGDVLNGVYGADRMRSSEIFEIQINMAVSIFKNYPLDIKVVPGNHDFTFDRQGIMRPLKILEERLKGEKCNFTAYDGYIQDFEIAGVIKRMMHLESFYFHDNVLSAVQRLYEFRKHGGLYVKCGDSEKKPVRFLECGHIHRTVEIYNSDFNVYISQPGSFVRGQNYHLPLVHVKGEVLDGFKIVREYYKKD